MIFPSGQLLPSIAWPLVLLLALLIGEWGSKWLRIPRVSLYAAIGFILARGEAGLLPADPSGNLLFLAYIALGFALFELGYRINLGWLKSNPWILGIGLLESALTFTVIYWLSSLFDMPHHIALSISALCIATSPVAIIRITNDLHSAGQVTERILHLCAINSLIAIAVLKGSVGYWHLVTSNAFTAAVWSSLFVVVISIGIGAVFGAILPLCLRYVSNLNRSATSATAIAITLLTALTLTLTLSPLLAALSFGFIARNRRLVLIHVQRNFGVLGDLLTIYVFVFVASLFEWQWIVTGLALGIILIMTRMLTKITVSAALAHASGTTFKKGILTGLAMAPLSAFAILLIEQTRVIGFELASQTLSTIAGMIFILELVGPLAIQLALVLAKEVPSSRDK